MRRNIWYIIGITLTLSCLILSAVIFLYTSLYYLTWMASQEPSEGPTIVFAADKHLPEAISYRVTDELFNAATWEIAQMFPKFALWTDGTSKIIIGMGWRKVEAPSAWSMKKHGPITILWETNSNPPQLTNQKKLLRQSVVWIPNAIRHISRVGVNGVLQSGAGAILSPHQPLIADAKVSGETVTIKYTMAQGGSKTVQLPEEIGDNNALYLSLYREVLPIVLTPEITQLVEKMVTNTFGLTKGTTPLFRNIDGADRFFFEAEDGLVGSTDSHQEGYVSVGIGGNPNILSDTVTARVREELAYRQPVEKVFQLPDGTLGRELVPGNIDVIETAPFDYRGCQPVQIEEQEFWHCRGADWAAITTDPERLLSSMGTYILDEKQQWRIHIPATRLITGDNVPITSIYGSGDTESGVLQLQVK